VEGAVVGASLSCVLLRLLLPDQNAAFSLLPLQYNHPQNENYQLPPQSEDAANLLTGCADGTAALFSLTGQQLRKLEGHTDRLGRVAWHPMGRHVVGWWVGLGASR
jgi:hypothetical protein